jgi:hypothetical protein
MKYLVLTTLLSLSLVACNMMSPNRRPAQYKVTDKEVALVRVPPKTINKELTKLAQGSDIIKSISPLSMDPVTRIISLRMTLKYPLNSLYNYEIKPKNQLSEEQEIEMAFSLPELVMSRYLSITFHKFKINGDDYLNAFSVVGAVVQTVMANSSLINYVFDTAGSSITNYRTMMTEIIEDNGILVNQTMKNIKFKLNLNYFDQLADFSEYKDLRVWSLEPALFQGQDVFFQMIAGFGKPSKKWKEDYFRERDQDIAKILKIRNGLYEEYSNIPAVKSILTSYLESILAKESIQYSKLDQVYKNEVDRLKGSFESQARKLLTVSEPTFEADPEEEYFSFIADQKEKIKNFVSDLDRRLTIDYNILAKGSIYSTRPLVTKRIGLDVLNAAMNYARDYEYDGQYFVKEAYVSIAPQVPGLIARGNVNIDLNYLLGQFNSKLVDEKLISKIPETTTGIPFELVLETKFEDNSVLGLDAKSITLFSGEKKLHFTRNSKNQDFMLDFLKIYLVQSMAAIEFDMGGESTLSEEEKTQKRFKELIDYLKALKVAYQEHTDAGILKNILKVIQTDITKNPHATAGEEYVKNKTKILFGDIIEYDSRDGLFKMKLNPKIALDNIIGAENRLQVWNIAPLYSREFNNTFLEIAVGNGVRSKKYVEETFDLRNDLDNANFVGIYNDNNRSTVDLLASLNFNYVESYANDLFKNIIKKKNGDYQRQLEKDEEQTHYIIDHVKLDIQDKKKILLDLNASVLKKKKGGLFGWGKWKVDKSSYAISAEVELESKSLEEVKHKLNSHKVPIYLTDQLIGVKLNRVKLKFGKPSLVNNALNKLANLNLTGSIGSRFRKLLLKIVNMYFQSSWKKQDDYKMYGDSLEEMVRVFTTNDQIMLMLNPRMGGPAFEVKLTGEEENFATKAIKVDSRNQELHVAFTAATAMAKIDRRELLSIVADTNDLFYKYLNIKNKKTFLKEMNNFQLVNQAVRDSDDEKMSLYNRLIKVMRNYDQVLQVANIPHKAKNTDRRITTTGNELLYFSATSYILYNRLYKITKKIKDWKLEGKVQYYKTLVEAKNKLFQNIFKPLLLKYRRDFHDRNNDILIAPYNYWTHNFYPDAFFSEAVYKELLKEGI